MALDRTKHLTVDLLMTYLVAPGTAIYVGYTDGYDNITLDPLDRHAPHPESDHVDGAAGVLEDQLLVPFLGRRAACRAGRCNTAEVG